MLGTHHITFFSPPLPTLRCVSRWNQEDFKEEKRPRYGRVYEVCGWNGEIQSLFLKATYYLEVDLSTPGIDR